MLMKADRAVLARSAPAGAITLGLLVAASILVAFVGFSGGLKELLRRWTVQEEYSHGFLIPVIAAWLLWTRRDALWASIGKPSWTGPLVILLAALLHIVGKLSSLMLLPQLAFILALIGIVLAFGGTSLLKVTFLPIVFLLFAIPLPYVIDAGLSFQLQLLSSQLGVVLHPAVPDPGLSRRQRHRPRRVQAAGRRGLQRSALSLSADEPRLSCGLSVPGADLAARAGVPVDHPDHDCDEQPAHRPGRGDGRSFRAAGCRRLPSYVRRLDHFHSLRRIAGRGDGCPGALRSGKKFFDVFYPPKIAAAGGAARRRAASRQSRAAARLLCAVMRNRSGRPVGVGAAGNNPRPQAVRLVSDHSG